MSTCGKGGFCTNKYKKNGQPVNLNDCPNGDKVFIT
jgi:hypothetical protein